jgi:hypothetical protein
MKNDRGMAFEESMAFTESQIGLFALTEDASRGPVGLPREAQTGPGADDE